MVEDSMGSYGQIINDVKLLMNDGGKSNMCDVKAMKLRIFLLN
jgi:hypothetical protein